MCEADRNLILFLSCSRKQFLNNQRQKHLTNICKPTTYRNLKSIVETENAAFRGMEDVF